MLYSLLVTALLMGLGGLPHCAAMCAAPCAIGLPRGVPALALLGRTMGYALLGGVAAGAAAWLASWSRWVGALQPIWVMLLAASVLLGVWMALTGGLPAWLQHHGQMTYRRLQAAMDPGQGRGLLARWPGLARWMPALLGMAWAALPCGLLYSAVVVAALAPSAAEGALVMAVFSLPGAVALYWLPRRLSAWRTSPAFAAPAPSTPNAAAPVLWMQRAELAGIPADVTPPEGSSGSSWSDRWSWLANPRWAVRSSGALLAAAAAWALAHRLHEQWLIWCA